MNGDDDRLTPELQSLLAAEKEAAPPDRATRDRLARRLGQTLGITLAAAGASTAGVSAASGAQTVLPRALMGKSLAAKLLVAAVIGGVGAGGVVTTMTLRHRHARHAPATKVGPRAAPAAIATPSSAPSPLPLPSPPSSPLPSLEVSVDPPSSPSPPAPRRADDGRRSPAHHELAAERALLADARAAMQRSDAARALAILDDHARRFAHGQLAEERDAMRVGALWLAGDHDGASRRAAEFARRHPDSLFLPSVERAVTDPAAPSP